MENKNLPIDRDKRLMLLKWLKQGYIDGQDLNALHAESHNTKLMSLQEAREFIQYLEKTY